MKKILILLSIAFLPVVLYSFRSAESNPGPLQTIAGKWYFNKIVAIEFVGTSVISHTIITESNFSADDIANFKSPSGGYICASDAHDIHQFIFKGGFKYNIDGGSLLLFANAANNNCGNTGGLSGVLGIAVETLTPTNLVWRGVNTATINDTTKTYEMTYYLSRTHN